MDERRRRLALVAPERRAIVERRMEVLDRFLEIEGPNREETQGAADALGIRLENFRRLVRAYAGTRDPLSVDAGRGARGPRGHVRHPGDRLVRDTLAGLPPTGSIDGDIREVQEVARRAGVALRSHNGLRELVHEWRLANGRSRMAATGLWADHVVVDLAVADPDGGITMPVASVLGLVGTGVLAVMLSLRPPSPATVAGLLTHADAVGQAWEAPGGVLEADGRIGDDWTAADRELAARGLRRRGVDNSSLPVGRLGGETVSPRLLGFRSYPNLVALAGSSRRRRRAKPRSGTSGPIPIETAQHAVDERVAAVLQGG